MSSSEQLTLGAKLCAILIYATRAPSSYLSLSLACPLFVGELTDTLQPPSESIACFFSFSLSLFPFSRAISFYGSRAEQTYKGEARKKRSAQLFHLRAPTLSTDERSTWLKIPNARLRDTYRTTARRRTAGRRHTRNGDGGAAHGARGTHLGSVRTRFEDRDMIQRRPSNRTASRLHRAFRFLSRLFFFFLSLGTKGAPSSSLNCGLSFFLRRGRETTSPRRGERLARLDHYIVITDARESELRRDEPNLAEPSPHTTSFTSVDDCTECAHTVSCTARALCCGSRTARLSPLLFQACAPRAHITRCLCLSVFVVRAIAYR